MMSTVVYKAYIGISFFPDVVVVVVVVIVVVVVVVVAELVKVVDNGKPSTKCDKYHHRDKCH
jgi:hypothetical protein